jgi:hypothetical protein
MASDRLVGLGKQAAELGLTLSEGDPCIRCYPGFCGMPATWERETAVQVEVHELIKLVEQAS